jgi:lipoate-protein ligase A
VGQDWIVEHHRGSAAELHGLEVPSDGRRRIWVLEALRPAVVLGSTQADEAVDRAEAERRGVDVARRRSGGGAVWVAPGDPVWVDLVVPRGDALWRDDVAAAFLPIGRAWVQALERLGVSGAVVHPGPMLRMEWSDLVCFAGRGPGEVFLGGAKVVGVSQRRNRGGARFQCAVPRTWDPEPLRALLVPPPPAGLLDGAGAGIGPIPTGDVVAALVDALRGT